MAIRVDSNLPVTALCLAPTREVLEESGPDPFRKFSGYFLPGERPLSFLVNIQTSVLDVLWKLSVDDPTGIREWIDNKKAQFEDFEISFRNVFYQFRQTSDPKPLVAFLNKGRPFLERSREQFIKSWSCNEEKYTTILEYYSDAIDLIATGRVEDLTQSAEQYYPAPETKEERFELAFATHKIIAGNVFRLTATVACLGKQLRAQISEKGMSDSHKKIHNVSFTDGGKCVLEPVWHNPDLSKGFVHDLNAAFSRILHSYNSQIPIFVDISDRVLMSEMLDRAHGIDCDEYHVQIYNAGFTPFEKWDKKLKDSLDFKPAEMTFKERVAYVDQWCLTYRNFIPRLRELHTRMGTICGELENLAGILKNFPLYCRYGNLKKLKERIGDKFIPLKRFDQIVLQEVAAFAEGFITNPSLISKYALLVKFSSLKGNEMIRFNDGIKKNETGTIMNLLKTNDREEFIKILSEIHRKGYWKFSSEIAELQKFRAFFYISENYKKGIRRMCDCMLSHPLQSLDPLTPHLFEKELRPQVEQPKKRISPPPKKSKIRHEAIQPDPPNPEQTLPEEPAQPIRFPLSVAEELEEVKGQMKKAFKVVNKDCKGKAALGNAEVNFDALIAVVARYSHRADRPLFRQEVMATVVDSIRYGALSLEQLLVALDCESNRISSPEELKGRLSHDLDYLLGYCQFDPEMDYPSEMTRWVHEARKAVCWSGNIGECDLGKGHVQSLLAKTKLFVDGNDAFTGDQLLRETMEFINKVGKFGGYLLWNIEAAKEHPSSKQDEMTANLKNGFSNCCQQLSQRAFAIQNEPLPSPPQIKRMNEQLNAFAKHVKETKGELSNEFSDSLDTIQNILLPHLGVEMFSQRNFHPFESSLHLRNVLLLNQMIAEETVRMVLSVVEPSLYYGRDEHDLSILVKDLKMGPKVAFSEEESEFLYRARSTRQMVRYPIDPLQKNKNQKLPLSVALQSAHELAQKGQIGYYEEEDKEFTTVGRSSTDPYVQTAKADTHTMVQVVEKILKCSNYFNEEFLSSLS